MPTHKTVYQNEIALSKENEKAIQKSISLQKPLDQSSDALFQNKTKSNNNNKKANK